MDTLFLEPASVTVIYNQTLQVITGKPVDTPVISPGCPLEVVLHSIFVEYPQMGKIFPPGKIRILVNRTLPFSMQPLSNGDRIELYGIG